MAWAFNYLRQQQSSSFCKAVIKNRGVFCFCSTAVKIVLSMFIQQTVNWRCTHRADPVSIIDLKWKEGKDQTNIFFFLISEKLPKLTKSNSFGTIEMLLFFYLFQLGCVLDGAQLEYKTTAAKPSESQVCLM